MANSDPAKSIPHGIVFFIILRTVICGALLSLQVLIKFIIILCLPYMCDKFDHVKNFSFIFANVCSILQLQDMTEYQMSLYREMEARLKVKCSKVADAFTIDDKGRSFLLHPRILVKTHTSGIYLFVYCKDFIMSLRFLCRTCHFCLVQLDD